MNAPQSRDGFIERALGAAGALSVIAGLLLPLLVVAALAAAGRIDREAALASWTVRAWGVGLGTALAARVAAASLRRRWTAALLGGAALSVVAHVAVLGLFRFDATWDLGIGEPDVPPRFSVEGAAARVPAIVARELPGRSGGDAVVELDGRPVSLPLGREIDVGRGLRVELQGLYPAPSFHLTRAAGALEGEGMLKFLPGERGYFQVALLPHRFYVTLPAAAEASAGRIDHLALEVFRGKVRVAKADRLAPGEPIAFEGLVLRLDEGDRWVRVRARAVHGRALLWLAGLLALAAGVAAVRRRAGAP